ncbi:uncharacterized protein LOC101845521, partial [Aplysia californica]|uniref:Uncharacterized protein LOC101845521 n=1 Tax=Aplysia californica TaxID=6500 RepID=A0ABM1W435_APLCA
MLTTEGWVEHDFPRYRHDEENGYLCQVPVGLPDVKLTCPPTDESLPADVTCTFKQAPWTNLSWTVGDKDHKATCYPDFCCKPVHEGFQANVDNSSGVVKSKFTILKADFERHARVTCSAQFKTGSPQSAFCDLPIYSKPDAPICTQTFTDTGVHVRCEVDKVYPWADCLWGRSPHKILSGSSSILNITGSRYKMMRCNLRDELSASGDYTYTVKAIPQVDGVIDDESASSIPTDVIVSLYKPQGCDNVEMIEGFGSLGNDANISVCVIAFPEPYDIQLSHGQNFVREDRYNTQFSYTKQPR